MTREMTTVGNPSWVGHSGPDSAAARKFYSEVLGLSVHDMPMKDGSNYAGIMVGEEPVGGFSPMVSETGSWTIYFTVADVDATAQKIVDAGGEILSGPMDMPGVGRSAQVKDPQGAELSIITYESQMA